MRTLLTIVMAAVLVTGCAASDAPDVADPAAGARVLDGLDLGCGLCHTIEAAEFTGTVGPDLDQLAPGYDRILDAVRTGPGHMPSYRSDLTEREMRDLAAHISTLVNP